MKQAKVAFFTVVYPGVEKYLPEFLSSLENQSYKNFDLIIINDGMDNYTFPSTSINTEVIDYTNSISKIREFGINLLHQKGYHFIVFGDSDDCFDSKRIELSLKLLDQNDVVVNDLVSYDGDKTSKLLFSKHLSNNQLLDNYFIKDKNVFGLSNTAIKMEKFSVISLAETLIAADWNIFTQLLHQKFQAIFTNDTFTNYRQHENNTIGLNQCISFSDVKKGVLVKYLHYRSLVEVGLDLNGFYKKQLEYFSLLLKNEDKLKQYSRTIIHQNNETNSCFWWGNIKGI